MDHFPCFSHHILKNFTRKKEESLWQEIILILLAASVTIDRSIVFRGTLIVTIITFSVVLVHLILVPIGPISLTAPLTRLELIIVGVSLTCLELIIVVVGIEIIVVSAVVKVPCVAHTVLILLVFVVGVLGGVLLVHVVSLFGGCGGVFLGGEHRWRLTSSVLYVVECGGGGCSLVGSTAVEAIAILVFLVVTVGVYFFSWGGGWGLEGFGFFGSVVVTKELALPCLNLEGGDEEEECEEREVFW